MVLGPDSEVWSIFSLTVMRAVNSVGACSFKTTKVDRKLFELCPLRHVIACYSRHPTFYGKSLAFHPFLPAN